jgi:hypothetical protein
MAEKTIPVTGGCQCGGVRYESTEPPRVVGYCHCRKCQKAYGAVSALFALFRRDTFRYTCGEPKFYQSSAWGYRGFCENCGTPLVLLYELDDPEPGVLIGTLDHPQEWPPTGDHMGIESQVPWNVIYDDLPRVRTDDDPATVAAKAAAGQGEE